MPITQPTIEDTVTEIINKLKSLNYTVATMESCTAGSVAATLTSVSGSSSILKESFITYSNEAKIYQGVPESVISEYGVYSRQTAQAMAEALLLRNDIGIGVTGTLGNPDPNNLDSKVGEVHCCIETKSGQCRLHTIHIDVNSIPSRKEQREAIVKLIINELNSLLTELIQPHQHQTEIRSFQ